MTTPLPHPRESDAVLPDGPTTMARTVPPSVTMYRHMVYGSGLSTVERVGLMHLLFLVQGQQSATRAELLEDLQREGIVGASGKLIGQKAVDAMFVTFIEKGYIRKLPRRPRPGVRAGFEPQAYELYVEPDANPDWQERPEIDAVAPEAQQPAAAQALARDPEAPTAEELAAAVDFLENLPRPWTATRATAERNADALARQVRRLGLAYDQELADELTVNPGGIKSYASVLPVRIANLRRRQTRFAPAAAAPEQGSTPMPPRPNAGPLSPCPRHRDVEAADCVPCNEQLLAELAARDAAAAARPAWTAVPRTSDPAPLDALSIIERARKRAQGVGSS